MDFYGIDSLHMLFSLCYNEKQCVLSLVYQTDIPVAQIFPDPFI